jgi:hypothetical protein
MVMGGEEVQPSIIVPVSRFMCNSRIQFKLLTFMYNCYVGEAPLYLTELLTKHVHYVPIQMLRSAQLSEGYYNVPFNIDTKHSVTEVLKPLVYDSGITCRLPLDIKQSKSLDTFKAKLKIHLFRNF